MCTIQHWHYWQCRKSYDWGDHVPGLEDEPEEAVDDADGLRAGGRQRPLLHQGQERHRVKGPGCAATRSRNADGAAQVWRSHANWK